MNQNHERNDPERIEPGDLHEKLCAYVLGEAPDEVRAEVEAALEVSAELRAERERLEATIGLVRRTLIPAGDGDGEDEDGEQAGADRLSPTAAAALMAAAEVRRPAGKVLRGPGRWSALRLGAGIAMAAGIAAIALTWATSERSRTHVSGTTLARREAQLDGRSPASRPAAESGGLEALQSLGYSADSGGSSDASSSRVTHFNQEPEPVARGYLGGETKEADAPESEALRSERLARADAAQRLKDSSADLKARREDAGLMALGYAGEESTAPATIRRYRGPGDSVPPEHADAQAGSSGADLETLRELGYSSSPATEPTPKVGPASPGSPAGSSTRLRAGAVMTGSDDYFLGHGQQVTDEGQAPARLRGLGYLGGAASAPQDAPVKDEVTGADFDRNVRGEDDAELVDQLEEMGYLGEGSESRRGAPSERERLQRRFDFVIGSCGRRPDERPRDMYFRFWGDNPFETTMLDAQSTFSVDVDTASYTLARRYLTDGHLPEKAQVRTEEFVNYFDADVPAPLEETFAIHTELAPSRFGEGPDSWMLRVAVRGKDVSREERQPLTLTFVIDVSGSMKGGGRLELVKHALRLLMSQLDARDSIAIVAFSNEARTILPMTSAKNRALIETAIHQLRPEGGTNAEAGVLMGYALAAGELTRNSHNRVVLLSDGVANIGNTDQATITAQVERQRQAGIYLNTVGVGMGNHNDALLEQLADKGDGVCNYVDDEAEARRALVERFTGAFEPIARDVKIQVEFDPLQVQRYRLLGYENRAIADRDFRNDAVDAGEVNAGHQVVALYELQAAPRAAEGSERPLATVRLRWKPPHAAGIASDDTEAATEVEQPVAFADAAPGFTAASAGYRRSVLAGQFAEFLRLSRHARHDSLDELLAEVRALSADPAMRDDDDLAELARLIERSRALILAERARSDDWSRALDTVREACYLQSQLEDLNLLLGRDRLDGLDVAIRGLQQRIAWLRERVEAAERDLSRAELERFERENALLAARLRELLRQHGHDRR